MDDIEQKSPIVSHGKRKGRKRKLIASCGFLENEPNQFSKEEGITLADSLETLGVDLRTRVKRKKKREGKSAR